VVVSVNNIVSSCRNKTCSYTYSESHTPTVHSIVPDSGVVRNGTTCHLVRINCTGCQQGTDNKKVMIGDTACNVTRVNQTEISCCLGINNYLISARNSSVVIQLRAIQMFSFLGDSNQVDTERSNDVPVTFVLRYDVVTTSKQRHVMVNKRLMISNRPP